MKQRKMEVKETKEKSVNDEKLDYRTPEERQQYNECDDERNSRNEEERNNRDLVNKQGRTYRTRCITMYIPSPSGERIP